MSSRTSRSSGAFSKAVKDIFSISAAAPVEQRWRECCTQVSRDETLRSFDSTKHQTFPPSLSSTTQDYLVLIFCSPTPWNPGAIWSSGPFDPHTTCCNVVDVHGVDNLVFPVYSFTERCIATGTKHSAKHKQLARSLISFSRKSNPHFPSPEVHPTGSPGGSSRAPPRSNSPAPDLLPRGPNPPVWTHPICQRCFRQYNALWRCFKTFWLQPEASMFSLPD